MPIWPVGIVADFAKNAYIPTMRAFHNDVARILPFVGIQNPGDVFMQIRASVVATPAWHTEGAPPAPVTDPSLSSTAFYFQRLSHQFQLDIWSERAKNDPNSLRRMCIEIGGDGFLDYLGDSLVNGAAAPSILGLRALIDPTQVLNVAGAPFAIDDLRRIIEKVGTGFPGLGCDALLTSTRGLREILRTLDPGRQLPWTWMEPLGKKVPLIDGIPLFVGPVPVGPAPAYLTSVIAICRSSPAGARILYAKTANTDAFGREVVFLPNQQATFVSGAYITGYYTLAQFPSSTGMLMDFDTSSVGNPL